MARSKKNVTLARGASFEVARLGRKGEAFWPKAYLHRSLGNRPRKVLRIGIVWPKAIFTEAQASPRW